MNCLNLEKKKVMSSCKILRYWVKQHIAFAGAQV